MNNEVYTKLSRWLRHLTGNITVLRANQNTPAPRPPYATFQVFGINDKDAVRGQNVKEVGDETRLYVRRFYSFTVRLQVFGRTSQPGEAETIVDLLLQRLRNYEATQDILLPGLSFMRILSGPDTVDGLIDSDFQSRVVIDLLMDASEDHYIAMAAIEQVNAEYELNLSPSDSISGTIEITPFEET